MTANDSWRDQGRQEHGWFGSGTGSRVVQQVGLPAMDPNRSDRINGAYPLEYLIGILSGASIVRVALSAAIRNFGPSSPPSLNAGKQDKHIPGTNNYRDGRSVLHASPSDLLQRFAGKGKQVGPIEVGKAGSREQFDTGNEIIGTYKSLSGETALTTRGQIIYDAEGTAHIVPLRQRGWTK